MQIIEFQCPTCQRVLRAPESRAGVETHCPACHQPVTVPLIAPRTYQATVVEISPDEPAPPVVAPSPAPPLPAVPVADQPCPVCAETIPGSAQECPFCGELLLMPTRSQALPVEADYRYGSLPERGIAVTIDYIVVALTASAVQYAWSYADPHLGDWPGKELLFTWTLPLLSLALPACYMAGMESSSFQATIGKLALGLQVIDDDGSRLTFWHALLRSVIKMAGMLPCFAGGLIMEGTDRRQALHDLVTGTLVVRSRQR